MSKQPVRARLLDALLSDIVLPPLPARDIALDEEEMFHHNAALRTVLGGSTCVEATNVARFFDDSYLGDGSFDAFWTDLKCLVPPHKRFFVEWEKPLIPSAKRMGMLFIACQPDVAEEMARTIIGDGARTTPAKIAEFRQNIRCRWIYLTMDFLEFAHKNDGEHISGLRGPFHIGAISIAEDGALLNFWMSHASAHIPKDESMQVAAASLVGWTTLAMMNCANIAMAEHKAPDAFQKARARSGKKPLVSYHTVRVDLDKTPRSIAAESLPGDGSTPRRHKKRGHMKDYRGGKGLFGRYKGVWYWGPMLAGSEEEGVIVSDYEVKP
jgi:hypothetical protein